MCPTCTPPLGGGPLCLGTVAPLLSILLLFIRPGPTFAGLGDWSSSWDDDRDLYWSGDVDPVDDRTVMRGSGDIAIGDGVARFYGSPRMYIAKDAAVVGWEDVEMTAYGKFVNDGTLKDYSGLTMAARTNHDEYSDDYANWSGCEAFGYYARIYRQTGECAFQKEYYHGDSGTVYTNTKRVECFPGGLPLNQWVGMKFRVVTVPETGGSVKLELYVDRTDSGTWVLEQQLLDEPGTWAPPSHKVVPPECPQEGGDTVTRPGNVCFFRTDGVDMNTEVHWRNATIVDLSNTYQTLVSDDFDSYPTGEAPGGGWTVDDAGGAGGTVTVAEVPSSTDRSVELRDTTAGENVKVTHSFPAQTGIVIAEFKMMMPTVSSWYNVALYGSGGTAVTFLARNDEFQYRVESTYYSLGQPMEDGVWYDVKLVADVAAKKCDFYIDGVLRASRADFRYPSVTNISSLRASTSSSNQDQVAYFDDARVYAFTEPPPSPAPTAVPTPPPPTAHPTASPTWTPTSIPTAHPTASPTRTPTSIPTFSPTVNPTASDHHQILVNDDFDAYPTGEPPGGGWTSDDAGGTVMVAQVPTSTDRSVELRDTTAGENVKVARSFPAQIGIVIAEFKMMMPTVSSWYNVALYGSGGTAVTFLARNDEFQYRVESTYYSLGQPMEDGVWYDIKLVADVAAKKCDFYIDGVLRASRADFRYPSVTNISSLRASTSSSNQDQVAYFDDARVYAVAALVSDDFDAYATGEAPGGGWTADDAGGAGGTVAVAEVPTSTDKSVELRDTTATENVVVAHSFPAQTGVVVADFRLMMPTFSSWYNVGLYGSGGAAVSLIARNDEFQYKVGSDYYSLGQPMEDGVWYDVKLVADVVAKKCNIYINGNLSGDRIDFRYSTVTDISSLRAGTSTSNQQVAYFDDARVYTGVIECKGPGGACASSRDCCSEVCHGDGECH